MPYGRAPTIVDAEAKTFPLSYRRARNDSGVLNRLPLLMIELRAVQKLNAGLLDANGSMLLGADDI